MKDSHLNIFDAKATLRKTELFECLDDEVCDLVANLVKWKQYRQGSK
jgi:hypothetical protein